MTQWLSTSAILAPLLTVIGTLIVLYLRSIKLDISKMAARLDLQEKRIEEVRRSQAVCKDDCHRTFVSKEDWLREAGFNRDKLEHVSNTLNRLEGKFQLVDKLPEICGQIAREIASQIKGISHE